MKWVCEERGRARENSGVFATAETERFELALTKGEVARLAVTERVKRDVEGAVPYKRDGSAEGE